MGLLLNLDVYCYFGCLLLHFLYVWMFIVVVLGFILAFFSFLFFFWLVFLQGTWALVRKFWKLHDSIMLMLNISNMFFIHSFLSFYFIQCSFAVFFFWFQSFTFISFSVQLHGLILLSHLVISFVSFSSCCSALLYCCTCISFISALSFHSFVWLHFISFH